MSSASVTANVIPINFPGDKTSAILPDITSKHSALPRGLLGPAMLVLVFVLIACHVERSYGCQHNRQDLQLAPGLVVADTASCYRRQAGQEEAEAGRRSQEGCMVQDTVSAERMDAAAAAETVGVEN